MPIPEPIRGATEELLTRSKTIGRVAEKETLDRLKDRVGSQFPTWTIDLFREFPLSGLLLGKKILGGDSFEDADMFELGDSALLEELNLESYPGIYIFPRGYLTIGFGITGAGDTLVLPMNSNDPCLYQVWHDISHSGEEIEQAILDCSSGVNLISSRLTTFLKEAIVESPW